MKTFLKTSLAVVSLLGLACLVGLMPAQAQETNRGPHALTVNPELAAEIAAVEQQPTIELSSLPYNGRGLTYFSAQFPYWPPMPCDALTVPVWSLGNGEYLMDDISVNYDALTSVVQTNGTADTASFMRPMGGAGGFSPDYSTLNGPYITLAPTATNGLYLITVWNNQGPANYEIWYTPVLANPSYPWTAIVAGPTGQTNFLVNFSPFDTGFYRAIWDTNSPPAWDAADPNNPSAGILSVYIDNPTNGTVIQ